MLNSPNTYMGIRIQVSPLMVDMVEDWSQVRSPARARRRLKRGFPQRIRMVEVPKKEAFRHGDTMVMHPDMYAALKCQLYANSAPPLAVDELAQTRMSRLPVVPSGWIFNYTPG